MALPIRTLLIWLLALALPAQAAAAATMAAGSHSGGHADSAIGEPGQAARVTRTVRIDIPATHREGVSTMIVLDVAGMTCGHCIAAVTRAVHTVDSGAEVKVDLATRRVEIESVTAHESALRAAIEEAGYAVAPA